MTSEERQQEEERERQARLARARMLTLIEKDDDEVKEEEEVKVKKSEVETSSVPKAVSVETVLEGESMHNNGIVIPASAPIIQKSASPPPPPSITPVSSTPEPVPGRNAQLGNNPLPEESKASSQSISLKEIQLEEVKNTNENKGVEPQIQIQVDKGMEASKVEILPDKKAEKPESMEIEEELIQKNPLVEGMKVITQVDVNKELRKETQIENNVTEEEPLPEYIKAKRKLNDNEIDPLDAFMAGVTSNLSSNL